MRKILLVLLVLFLLLGGGYIYNDAQYKNQLTQRPREVAGTIKEFKIDTGSPVKKIARDLFTQELIVEEGTFIRYISEQGKEKNLLASTFYIPQNLTIPEVAQILTGEKTPSRVRITIPEGYTLRDIEKVLVDKGFTTEKDFDECVKKTCAFQKEFTFLPKNGSLEGYLFPDTYFFDKESFTVESFLRNMLLNFEKRVVKGLEKEIADSEYSLSDLIKMASIIEKESRPADDQEIVAGILWKRLENNVQLAVDATNRYIKSDPLAPITIKELTSNNPYNTRKVKGLPPTAISNPGLASLRATLNPKSSPHWYYLHDKNGKIHFASTENEHNKNKALYIE